MSRNEKRYLTAGKVKLHQKKSSVKVRKSLKFPISIFFTNPFLSLVYVFVLLAQIPLKIGWEITEKLNNNNREGTKMPQKIAPCNHLCI